MNKTKDFFLIRILLTSALILWCLRPGLPSYAQEQYVAESFGLYSKGIEYYHSGKLYEAKEVLERAVKLDPRNDEAQGYLDLVNAELKMRSKGKFDFYQKDTELIRESNFVEHEETAYEASEYYEPEEEYYGPEDEYEYYYEDEWEEPEYSEDKIKAVTDSLNEKISPARIMGEYKMSAGFTSEDFIWKEANGDYNERNFRMIDHHYPKTNTFDTRVYDKVKVLFDTNKDGGGLNFHSDITVDPWSFVGKTDKFTIADTAGVDRVELEFKYWSGTRSVINERYYTLDQGLAVDTTEYKVVDGKIMPTSVSSDWSYYNIPETEVDMTFQPFREMWFENNTDNLKWKVFPFGLEDQALSSDDPLELSNHHIYWEPSPWLDEWIPGHINEQRVPVDFWAGTWSNDLSFFTRDSEMKRLTALRGVSLMTGDPDNSNLAFTLATPKGLWQEYESVNSIPGAIRAETWTTDSFRMGFVDTFRMGLDDGKTDSYNNVFGLDFTYELDEGTKIDGEIAMSKTEDDRKTDYTRGKNGTAGHLAFTNDTKLGRARLAFTHMDGAFDPGLASYKETRRDQSWSRHIYFKEPLEYSSWGSAPLTYDDIDPFRIGDGIDIGRKVVNFRLDTEDVLDGRMDNLIDYRYVRDANHKYVEGVLREENTYRFSPEWSSKFLAIYHDLPDTKAGIDPILYDADTGEFLTNASITDGNNPSLSTYSLGIQYEPDEWISFYGIYENTNDSTIGAGNDSSPRALLNDYDFTREYMYGLLYRSELPFLYSQGFFDLPPYDRFNVYKAGVSLRPSEYLGIDFDFTKNDFKFATGSDDNLNHFGTTVKYRFNPKLTGFFKYVYSKSYNLYRLNTSGDLKYEDHHNVFVELDYNVSDYGVFIVQFGEGAVVSTAYSATMTPYGDFYPTLDTQHILRVYYEGKF